MYKRSLIPVLTQRHIMYLGHILRSDSLHEDFILRLLGGNTCILLFIIINIRVVPPVAATPAAVDPQPQRRAAPQREPDPAGRQRGGQLPHGAVRRAVRHVPRGGVPGVRALPLPGRGPLARRPRESLAAAPVNVSDYYLITAPYLSTT